MKWKQRVSKRSDRHSHVAANTQALNVDVYLRFSFSEHSRAGAWRRSDLRYHREGIRNTKTTSVPEVGGTEREFQLHCGGSKCVVAGRGAGLPGRGMNLRILDAGSGHSATIQRHDRILLSINSAVGLRMFARTYLSIRYRVLSVPR